MPLKRFKWFRRLKLIAANSANNLLLMAFGPLVSLLVVRLASAELWGAFVSVMLAVQLGAHIVGWGNKEYLLRAFSRNPAGVAQAWQTSFFSRLLLYGGFCLFSALWFPAEQLGWIIVWGAGLALTQSFEALILYRKTFIFAAIVEAFSLIILITPIIILKSALSLTNLLAVFALVYLLKGFIFSLKFKADIFSSLQGKFSLNYFQLAFWFFLLGFSGLINSRVDLYAVSYFLPKEEVGQYQVFNTFMLYVQSLAAFVLMPFVKNLYRLGYKTTQKIAWQLFFFGLVILLPALVAINLILSYLYHFQFEIAYYFIGGLAILPIFFYLPIIYALYKNNFQHWALNINLFNIALTLLLNIILLPRLGMIGALVSVALVKWMTLGIYVWQGKTIQNKK